MRTIILTIISILYIGSALAQAPASPEKTGPETVVKTNRLTDSVVEKFRVLKSDKYTRQGLYQALYQKNYALASGYYNDNKRDGIWHFFDNRGHLVQNYNYKTNQVTYEAPEDTTSNLHYVVDVKLSDTAETTKPIKIGGRFFGYLPYLNLFKLPPDLMNLNPDVSFGVVELLVSPLGRLASFKVHIYSGSYERTFNMSIDVPDPADKIFTPATVNGEAVGCRVIIKCAFTSEGKLEFY